MCYAHVFPCIYILYIHVYTYVKIDILICTGLMLNDHSNPYIESTTVLSDTTLCCYWKQLVIMYNMFGLSLYPYNIVAWRNAISDVT